MGDTRKPTDKPAAGDSVTTEVGNTASETEPDLKSMLEEAEAEAAEAEAAATAARAKVSAMRSEQEEKPVGEDEAEDDDKRMRRLWPPQWSTVAKIVAVIVIVGSLAGSGTIIWQHHNASVRKQHEQEFIDTAKQGVVDLTSIDFNKVRDQVRHIIDNSMGSFKDDFVSRSDDFIKVAEASKAVGKGTVSAAAVEKMASDEAVVLVVGSEQITNAVGNQQPRSFRFRVTVTRDGDALKLSKLELVL